MQFIFLVTGNANYNMNSTHLTILGFTQPEASKFLINDISATNSGFVKSYWN